MKTLPLKVISLLLAFIIISQQGFAATILTLSKEEISITDFECFDEDAFYSEFSELDELASYLNNEEITYAELEKENEELLLRISPNSATPFSDDVAYSDDPFGISSFLWGCVGGISGIVLVYVMTNSKSEARKAFNGCLTSHIVGVLSYTLIYTIAYSQSTF